MFAIADSASSFCARVMRGTASIANTVSLRAASRSTSALFCAGQTKLMSVGPRLEQVGLVGAIGPRDRLPHLQHDVGLGVDSAVPSTIARAGLDVGGVRERRRLARAGLDHHLEPELHHLLDGVRRRGDARLVRVDLLGNAHLHGAAGYTDEGQHRYSGVACERRRASRLIRLETSRRSARRARGRH